MACANSQVPDVVCVASSALGRCHMKASMGMVNLSRFQDPSGEDPLLAWLVARFMDVHNQYILVLSRAIFFWIVVVIVIVIIITITIITYV